jgi:hypothetical protein
MFDEVKSTEDKIEFYKRDIDNPHSVNGFRGTWNFSDHTLIPNTLYGFITRYFGQAKLRRIPLDRINQIMNEVWEGPGSLEKLFRMELEMRQSGKLIKFDSNDFKDKKKADEEEELDIPLSMFGNEDLEVGNFEKEIDDN